MLGILANKQIKSKARLDAFNTLLESDQDKTLTFLLDYRLTSDDEESFIESVVEKLEKINDKRAIKILLNWFKNFDKSFEKRDIIYRTIISAYINKENAKDLIAETYVEILQNPKNFHPNVLRLLLYYLMDLSFSIPEIVPYLHKLHKENPNHFIVDYLVRIKGKEFLLEAIDFYPHYEKDKHYKEKLEETLKYSLMREYTIPQLFDLLTVDQPAEFKRLILESIDEVIDSLNQYEWKEQIKESFTRLTEILNELVRKFELICDKWKDKKTEPYDYFLKDFPFNVFITLFDYGFDEEENVLSWPEKLDIFELKETSLCLGFDIESYPGDLLWEQVYYCSDVDFEKIELILYLRKYNKIIYSLPVIDKEQFNREWKVIKRSEENKSIENAIDYNLFSCYIKPYIEKALDEFNKQLTVEKVKLLQEKIASVEKSFQAMEEIFR